MTALTTRQPWAFAGASQGRTFLRCASRWVFEELEGIQGETTDAQLFGSIVHRVAELCLVGGIGPAELTSVFLDNYDRTETTVHNVSEDHRECARRLLTHCPPGPIDERMVELVFASTTLVPGIEVRGTIDLVDPNLATLPDGRQALRIVDHKTTSHLKWAPLHSEVKAHFQALVYTVACAELFGWTGPILFVFNYVERKAPFRCELRSHLFEPAEVVEALAFVAETFRRMAATVELPDVEVGHNLDACGDYASKLNPDGCPHRMRCARLGRPTMGAMSILFNPALLSGAVMSDALSTLLAKASAAPPPPAPITDKATEARAAMKQRIWAIDPEVTINDHDDVNAVYKASVAKQTTIITEIATLDPSKGTEAAVHNMRVFNLPKLRTLREAAAKPEPVEAMLRPALVAEVCKRHGCEPGDVEAYGDEQLRTALLTLRAEQATSDHAINSPEQIDQTLDPDLPARVAAGAPQAPKKATRGNAPKIEIEHAHGAIELKLVSKCTKDELREYISATGLNYPRGKGATKRARGMVLVLMTDSKDVERFGPFEGAAPKAAPPPNLDALAQSQLETGLGEIRQLRIELNLAPTKVDSPTPQYVVEEVGRLRQLRDEASAAALELPAPPPAKPFLAAHAAATPADVIVPPLQTGAIAATQVGDKRIEYHKPGDTIADVGTRFTLYINCRPDSGVSRQIEGVVEQFGAAVAQVCKVPHYLVLDYSKGPRQVAGMVHTAITTGQLTLRGAVYCSTHAPTGQALVDVLVPLAREVVRGDG